MTAEVAIMNKYALVFAADSATTVTSWAKGSKETRFFKGANKLFQLSTVHPVGLMINGSASLQRLPWEIIVKEFRAQLASDSCDRLATYSQRFFNFVRGHTGLFPDAHRKQAWERSITRGILVASRLVKDALDLAAGVKPALDAYTAAAQDLLEEARTFSPTAPVSEKDVEAALARKLDDTAAEIEHDLDFYEVPYVEVSRTMAELAIRTVMTDHTQ